MKIKNVNVKLYRDDFLRLIDGHTITIKNHCSEVPINISLDVQFSEILRIISQVIAIKNVKKKENK